MSVFSPFAVFDLFSVGFAAGAAYATVPIVLTDPEGVVFTDENGVVLTHGTKRVRLIPEEPQE